MATKSKVIAVAVVERCHSPLSQPKNGVRTAGRSEIRWTLKGTYSANNQCVVVLEAERKRNKRTAKVNGAGSGGVFSAGTDGTFCELTLELNDQDNWTASVATDKDVDSHDEYIFTAGTG